MSLEEITHVLRSYIDQSIGGLEKEHTKFDFKAEWYDLTRPQGINEFLKDTTAIANTFGPDGFIVIGFNERNKTFMPARFRDCGLTDTSRVIDLINKKVDRLFDIDIIDVEIDDNPLSVIHIPPSIDKPHVIRLYQTFEKDGNLKKEEEHKMFVKKGSRVFPASRYDIELMYYDRKNIIPEYNLHLSYFDSTCGFNIRYNQGIVFSFYPTIENTGLRPVAISRLLTNILFEETGEELVFSSEHQFEGSNILIEQGSIFNGRIEVSSREVVPEKNRNNRLAVLNSGRKRMIHTGSLIVLANGKKIPVVINRL